MLRLRYIVWRPMARSGRIDLQHDPGGHDRLVLGAHGAGDGLEVRILRRVVVVRLEERDHTRRGGVHERRGRSRSRDRRLQVRDVRLHRFEALDADLAHAARAAVLRGRTGVGELPEQPRKLDEILARLARRVPVEAGDAVLDVGRVADLAHLAVTDEIDAGLNLAAHDLGDAVPNRARSRRGVRDGALLAGEQHVGDGLRAGQAADVRRQDPVDARVHRPGPSETCCSRCGLPRASA